MESKKAITKPLPFTWHIQHQSSPAATTQPGAAMGSRHAAAPQNPKKSIEPTVGISVGEGKLIACSRLPAAPACRMPFGEEIPQKQGLGSMPPMGTLLQAGTLQGHGDPYTSQQAFPITCVCNLQLCHGSMDAASSEGCTPL